VYSSFNVIDVAELSPPNNAIIEFTAGVVRDALIDPRFLEEASKWLEWPALTDWTQQSKPRPDKLTRGVYGEAIAAEMMRAFHHHHIPVSKLRYTITRGQTLPGTDIIALTLDEHGDINGVCFIEVKLRTTKAFATDAVIDASKQLSADYGEALPSMLKFIAERLQERSDPLFEAYMRYMRDRRDLSGFDSFRIFLFWDQAAWSDNLLQSLDDETMQIAPVTVHVVSLPDMVDRVRVAYSSVPADCNDNDD